MKKILYNILFIIYAIIAVITTICLLSYNKYKITELGNNVLIIVNDDSLAPDYRKGDLVIVNKADKKKINVGDKVFFYRTHENEIEISLANITKQETVSSTETTYSLEGDYELSNEYLIGPSKSAKVVKNVGSILRVLESKWGFLFIIVLPSLIAFLYEIGVIISEVRDSKKMQVRNNLR